MATTRGPTRIDSPGHRWSGEQRSAVTVAGILLGVGVGGFIDGIVLHQILQWHHMGTAHGVHATYPDTTVPSLEDNTLWDGLFHLGTWVVSLVGLFLLWGALRRGHRTTWRSLAGLLLMGWGMFNVVEGLINHQLLAIHHVRDDLGGPASWDVAFLILGVALTLAGVWIRRRDVRSVELSDAPPTT